MAEIAVLLTANETALLSALGRVEAKNKQLEEGFHKTRKAASGASQVFSQMAGYLGQFVGIGAAIQGINSGLAKIQEKQQGAAQRNLELRTSFGQLAQVAEGEKPRDKARDLQMLVAKARELYASGGAQSEADAANVMFMLRSTGQMQHFDLIKEMMISRVVDSEDMANMVKAGRAIQASMGEKETGDLRDIFSKGFAASTFTHTRAEELLQIAAKAGPSAKAFGMSDEEMLAATAIVSEVVAKRPMLAGTNVAAFYEDLTKLQAGTTPIQERKGRDRTRKDVKFDFKGKTTNQVLEDIEKRGLTEAEMQATFSDQGLKAYRILLTNRERLGQATAAIVKGQATDEVSTRMKLYKQVPALKTAAIWAEEENKKKLAEQQKYGPATGMANALVANQLRMMQAQGYGEPAILASQALMGTQRTLMMDDAAWLKIHGRNLASTKEMEDRLDEFEAEQASADQGGKNRGLSRGARAREAKPSYAWYDPAGWVNPDPWTRPPPAQLPESLKPLLEELVKDGKKRTALLEKQQAQPSAAAAQQNVQQHGVPANF